MKRYELPSLPYGYNELQPSISERIMTLHHTKHHAGYVKKANAALDILESHKNPDLKCVLRDLSFNLNGHILHSHFWMNMQPYQKQNEPDKSTERTMSDRFGSFSIFKTRFTQTALSVEGSGWAALLKGNDNELHIMQIENHNKLFLSGYSLILLVDVWEHAYYLDYEQDREQYLENWWNVVNWGFVSNNL